ncbi:hypothetical protein LY76DRAFT_677647 [Colletotrichum caudatum]|nr:hypothetical protein LY76DRAFT_677647 [Colletotrichum caudatum]
MQFFNTIALASALIGAVNATPPSPNKCNADNCLRQVRASAFPTRSGTADCQAFQTVTSTVLTTTTVDAPTAAAKVKRASVNSNRMTTQLTKSAAPTIPAYASGCSNSAQYASACSCAGVTASTKTVTSTVTSTAACPTSTYAIQQQGSADGNMNYGVLAQEDATLIDFRETVDLAGASKFIFVADSANPTLCRLQSATDSSAISFVRDSNPARFGLRHFIRIADPTKFSGPETPNNKISPVYCVRGAANKLQCTAVDSAQNGAAPQTTLFTHVDSDILYIGADQFATSTYYVLVAA